MCLAVPGKIVVISGDDPYTRTGDVSFSGLITKVNLAYVPEVKENDYVIVHAGFAISVLDEEEAQATLASFDELKQSLEQQV
ncbi:MAG: HypC/HybG/HupF family hydrogenase formation chaperone [Gammaproteobacteria bacterium]|jgi:hydrogenase expression/formation protein HypC|nr:HypC/HybG/HupF family hydrogenase formation chaperone [Gammaproteobacteria bacterium]MBT5222985.1 HypC/HybG/HupF family hydrogenase formation chaperone [Gammaproteobacteria bacterium]MBT5824608.1 HypC/HybG/HupF family hydrogenase formation chaperone [Gammaproteobacteria bacterium]MBT5965964.1 HypC/HybG/HupF family hydrogenase formation chaperone [Gammaproteobacteria bacterium]MBT6419428.1 HypC/HybG/HupF family hydrogenase formation chaperone [Gammaproteobacteria bacterium]